MQGFMFQPNASRWWVRGVTALVWALAVGSMAWWGLHWVPPMQAPAHARLAVPTATLDPSQRLSDVSRLLGATVSVANNDLLTPTDPIFVLKGVLAGSSSQAGAALLAQAGQPARPYRVGSPLGQGWVLQSVQARSAVLADAQTGAVVQTLRLPAPGGK